jgi:hypothetical protein
MLIAWLQRQGRGLPLSLKNIDHTVLRFAERIQANPALAERFRLAETGAVFSASYVVARGSLHFSPTGQGNIPNLKQFQGDIKLAGWFKIMPHPLKPRKTLFVFDAQEKLVQPEVRRSAVLPSLSVNEHFMSLYVFLVKSGAGNFSIRSVTSGEKATEVDPANWTKTSQMLFPGEDEERAFISYLHGVIK